MAGRDRGADAGGRVRRTDDVCPDRRHARVEPTSRSGVQAVAQRVSLGAEKAEERPMTVLKRALRAGGGGSRSHHETDHRDLREALIDAAFARLLADEKADISLRAVAGHVVARGRLARICASATARFWHHRPHRSCQIFSPNIQGTRGSFSATGTVRRSGVLPATSSISLVRIASLIYRGP